MPSLPPVGGGNGGGSSSKNNNGSSSSSKLYNWKQRGRTVVKTTTKPTKSSTLSHQQKTKRTKMILMFIIPMLAIVGTTMNYYFLPLTELGFGLDDETGGRGGASSSSSSSSSVASAASRSSIGKSWCDQVKKARSKLMPQLRINYECDDMMPATSAVVCMLTDGTTEEKASRVVFTARDYINGAMALGASVQRHIDPLKTHQLLLLREGFTLDDDDMIRLKSVGWTIGTAPNFDLAPKYIPKFPRYKTTYTKVTAIGLSEYDCVMLMDADTLAVGDLRGVLSDCKHTVFRHPANRVGGVIDLYSGRWKLFNTGSILWKTSTAEMERVYQLSKDSSFMKRFSSDQAFLNSVYSEREHNLTFNKEIVDLDTIESRTLTSTTNGQQIIIQPVVPHNDAQRGAVVPLSWDYNAQTHVEVQNPDWWEQHRPTVKVLHFTEKKGWQCNKTLEEPPPIQSMPKKCPKENPICFCREAHLYWKALEEAEDAATKRLEVSKRYNRPQSSRR
mmetsp:Transcript_10945/g.26086  ORF Transcript_10945/g.26086 Transcript_10945/m.26086 type:complete len:503 (-) Transcript_10945:77-1585(-)